MSGIAPGDGRIGRVLDVVFVTDCSGSMSGERVGALNWAARTVVPTLRAHAEEHPEVELRLRVLRFATGAAFVTAQPEPIGRFIWTPLAAHGESDMGAALRLLAQAFAHEAAPREHLPPVIVLFSDGYPSDDVEPGLEALLATELGSRAIRIPIAIGQDADMELLRRFSSDATQAVLRSHDVEMLVGRMRWMVAGPIAGALVGQPNSSTPVPSAGGEPGRPIADVDGKPDEDTW